jgi:hypothetical protein
MTYTEEIQNCKSLAPSWRSAALSDIKRMQTDADYRRKVKYSPEATTLRMAFDWYESGQGISFWGKVQAELNMAKREQK